METALKQRLVGALVLVALAVIFLPMLVKGPAPASGVDDVSLDAPDAPETGFETRVLPLDAPAADGRAALPEAATRVASGAASSATEATNATNAMMPPPTTGGDYAVTFGSYATQADAARVVAALRNSQLPGYQEPHTNASGRTLHRVRIGPYATQAEAEAARLRAAHVRDDVGSKVIVLDATAPPAAVAANAPATSAATQAASTPATPAATPDPLAQARADARKAPPLTDAQIKAKTAAAEPRPVTTKPAAPVESKPEPPRAGASGVGFAVQLGAFGNAEEAAKLRDRARAAGFSAFVEQVRTDKGTLNRVRIGPVADRADADRLRAEAASQLGVNGLVRPHP